MLRLKPFVHLTRNDHVKCALSLVAMLFKKMCVNCGDKYDNYKILTTLIWVTGLLLMIVKQRSSEDI